MKHADKVIELMAAYPGREFKMQQIARYVCPSPKDLAERRAVRKAVLRVLDSLWQNGSVLVRPPAARRGGYAVYWWRK